MHILKNTDKRRLVERISGTIENLLLESKTRKFKHIDDEIFLNVFNDETIKTWRCLSHITRHKSNVSFEEWNTLKEYEKDFLILTGFSILLILLNKK